MQYLEYNGMLLISYGPLFNLGPLYFIWEQVRIDTSHQRVTICSQTFQWISSQHTLIINIHDIQMLSVPKMDLKDLPDHVVTFFIRGI